MIASYIFIVGLMIGSFLNVCIYRIPIGESIVFPSSHCTKCNTRLKAVDLIPVLSYLLYKGKCKYCSEKISFRYAGVEILTAFVFLLLYIQYGMHFEFIAYAMFMSILIVVFFIDIDYLIIPDKLVILSSIIGLVVVVYACINGNSLYGNNKWYNPALGVLIGSGFLMLVAVLGKIIYKCEDVMGMGDVKIFIPIGLFLGWKMTIVTLMLTYILAGFISVFLIVIGIKERKSTIAFGPFIVGACFITILYGWDILNWWISRFYI